MGSISTLCTTVAIAQCKAHVLVVVVLLDLFLFDESNNDTRLPFSSEFSSELNEPIVLFQNNETLLYVS